jgi:hypothetical protein
MDFPTALRYLMAGRTIHRASSDYINFRLGTFHETCRVSEEKHFTDETIIIRFWPLRPSVPPILAELDGHDMLATDWELVE